MTLVFLIHKLKKSVISLTCNNPDIQFSFCLRIVDNDLIYDFFLCDITSFAFTIDVR